MKRWCMDVLREYGLRFTRSLLTHINNNENNSNNEQRDKSKRTMTIKPSTERAGGPGLSNLKGLEQKTKMLGRTTTTNEAALH